MFVVGLTGGIGSGKTAVSNRFAALGIDIVDADVVARVVVEPGTPALAQIREHFGADILQADGGLDRAKLRSVVFADAQEKHWLEQLLHPLIAAEVSRQLQAATSPYALFVSPLLIEAGQIDFCDRVVVVDAPEVAQLSRTTARDNNTEAQVKSIMGAQLSRNERLASASDVIDNSGSLEQLDQAVDALHHTFLALAREHTSHA
jgi:dephospho-CoA kinase